MQIPRFEGAHMRPPNFGAVLVGLIATATAQAQTTWTVDRKASLAWWQVSPHLNHLWATTCPGEPSWRPGEGRSSGWKINPYLELPPTGYANVEDTVHVPLYPRRRVHQVLQTAQFPEITFTLDSLVGMTKQADTLFGSAVGTLAVRGVQEPTTAAVKAFPEAGGMRVLSKWRIPATTLQLTLIPQLRTLGLGVNTLIWKDFFMGADLVFRPQATGAK